MPTISNFDIASDLKVEFFMPEIGSTAFIVGISKLGGTDLLGADGFVIGVSLLGGSDVLGTTSAFDWRDLACTVAKAQLSMGGTVQDQLYFQPQPGQASMTLQSFAIDPNYRKTFRPGTGVRLRLVKDAVDQVIWSGVIDSINVTYDVDGNNLMQLTAYDNLKKIFNTRIGRFNSTTGYPGYVTPLQQLSIVAAQLGTSMSAISSNARGRIPSVNVTDVIPTEFIYDAIQVGLGIFWLDPETGEFSYIDRPSNPAVPSGTPVIGNNHGDPNHLCMSDIQVSTTDDTVYNSLKVIRKNNTSSFVLRENQDSIDLYGKYAVDVTINTTDTTRLNAWADAVFAQYGTQLVDAVETPAIDRLGNLTEAAFFTPGQLVGVKFDQGTVEIDDYFTVTKVGHYIDPDNWFTTLEVWKEA